MIELRPKQSLGGGQHGWLTTHHHFSFADYYDPARMAWGNLRVWNDDLIAPYTGFGAHPHQNMEIVTYVRQGAITHKDNLGHSGRTQAGDVQVMSAGTGIVHAEHNAEATPTQIFQIWIQPDAQGGPPAWDTRPFPKADRAGVFVVLAAGSPQPDDALPIRADARVLGINLPAGTQAAYTLAPGRRAYLVPSVGRVRVGTCEASAGDGLAIADEAKLIVQAIEDCEIIMVDTR